MSELKVEILSIKEIQPHPNADRLEICKILDWNCIIPKGKHKVGDLVVYFPIDSILLEQIETLIFGPDSKVKLHNHRVKTIKLRGVISQGLVVGLDILKMFKLSGLIEGSDVTKLLGVTKYEPEVPKFQQTQGVPRVSHKQFKKYTDINNIKNFPQVFQPNDIVVITSKIHGTNFRAGWVPFIADTLFKKIKKFIGLAPEWEFVYGSHNCQLDNKLLGKYKESKENFHNKALFGEDRDNKAIHTLFGQKSVSNVYAKTVIQYDLMNRIPKGYVVYGEIYGSGIQKNYNYGCAEGVTKLMVFDIMYDNKYLDYGDFDKKIMEFDFNHIHIPVLYIGEMKDINLQEVCELAKNEDCSIPEGCVVKSVIEENSHCGRKVLKYINPEYLLLKDNTDYH